MMHPMGDVYISFVSRLLQSGMLTLNLFCAQEKRTFADDRGRKIGESAHEAATKDFDALGRRVLGAATWEGREAEGVNV